MLFQGDPPQITSSHRTHGQALLRAFVLTGLEGLALFALSWAFLQWVS